MKPPEVTLMLELPDLPEPDQVVTVDVSASASRLRKILAEAKQWLVPLGRTIDPTPAAKFYRWCVRLNQIVNVMGMSQDALLDARELQRRAERALGQTVRNGQEAGLIAVHGGVAKDPTLRGESPARFFEGAAGMRTYSYKFADRVSDEIFDKAIAACREDGILTREYLLQMINSFRTVDRSSKAKSWRVERIEFLAAKGYTSTQIAHDIGYARAANVRRVAKEYGIRIAADSNSGPKPRGVDPTRIVEETVHMLEGVSHGLQLVADSDIRQIEPDQAAIWNESLRNSLIGIMHLRKELSRLVRDN